MISVNFDPRLSRKVLTADLSTIINHDGFGKRIGFVKQLDFTAGDLKLAYNATGAMCFDANGSPQDLSPYAGGTAANYYLEFLAGATLVGSGYAGPVGGGEALGANRYATLDLSVVADWGVSNVTVNDANTFTTSANNGYVYADSTLNTRLTVGTLYKISFATSETAGVTSLSNAFTTVSDGSTDVYRTCTAITPRIINSASGAVVDVTTLDVKPLTDIPNTGLKLYSTKALATQSLASQPGVASVNAITTVRVYRVY